MPRVCWAWCGDRKPWLSRRPGGRARQGVRGGGLAGAGEGAKGIDRPASRCVHVNTLPTAAPRLNTGCDSWSRRGGGKHGAHRVRAWVRGPCRWCLAGWRGPRPPMAGTCVPARGPRARNHKPGIVVIMCCPLTAIQRRLALSGMVRWLHGRASSAGGEGWQPRLVSCQRLPPPLRTRHTACSCDCSQWSAHGSARPRRCATSAVPAQ